ncbi:grip and coiled-coil domain-containing protein 2 [Plakobranchus ocellatus]|uniref:Mediator of RNA polymerase II transcription subunit 11 n=1 Tax=Plakobranchus ocellatus TaxID=259542 RepID=A0AAV3XS00_9GAST|nr:grip and coiled-coil domain-containing protein 2 [Plakobranchus ocellatus]
MASVQEVGAPREKLQALEKIEQDIASALSSAASALQELSKDKPAQKHVDSHSTAFIKTLQEVENGLSQQISYLSQVSTSQPHEGSSYASQKDMHMAMHRSAHVKSRLSELEKIKIEHLRQKHTGIIRPYSANDSQQPHTPHTPHTPQQPHTPHTPQPQQQQTQQQQQQKQRDQQTREQQAQL